jgi:predicted nucleic acid-binding protein
MFLDTSIIIEIFRSKRDSDRFKEIYRYIENEPLFISVIQIGEISDWCLKNGIEPEERISKIKEICTLVPLNEDICLEASRIKYEMRSAGVDKFSLIDGIILSSARYMGEKLLTTDKDFRKAEDAIIL